MEVTVIRPRRLFRQCLCGLFIVALVLIPGFSPALADSARPAASCSGSVTDPLLPIARAHAGTKPGLSVIGIDVIHDLIDWIEVSTDYDVSKTRSAPPEISFCASGETILYESNEVLVDHSLRAAYDFPNRRIFLVRPWSANDIRNISTLLHELIHDVQLSNRIWKCLQRPEWEAYNLQNQWLAENGIASDFDWIQIYLLSKCPKDIHP